MKQKVGAAGDKVHVSVSRCTFDDIWDTCNSDLNVMFLLLQEAEEGVKQKVGAAGDKAQVSVSRYSFGGVRTRMTLMTRPPKRSCSALVDHEGSPEAVRRQDGHESADRSGRHTMSRHDLAPCRFRSPEV